MAGKDVERYVGPKLVEDPRARTELMKSGLSPEFPGRLKALNDVLADRNSRFAGVRITLSPESDEPAPIVEVKRRKDRHVVIDIDANVFDPSLSTGSLEITSRGRDAFLGFQKLTTVQYFFELALGEETPMVVRERRAVIDDKLDHPTHIIANDFSKLTEEDLNDFSSTSVFYLYFTDEDRSQEPIFMFRVPERDFEDQKLIWMNYLKFSGQVDEIERVLELAIPFFNFDPE